LAKPFTEMTDFEKLVNRRRLAAGQPADWTESVDRDLVAKVDAAARRRRIEAATAASAKYSAAAIATTRAHAAVWAPVLEHGARRRVEIADEIGRLHAALFSAEEQYARAVEVTMIAAEHGAELKTDVVGALEIGLMLNPETPNAARDRQFFKHHIRGPIVPRAADAEAGEVRQEALPAKVA
jgi:hypothetical protein